MMGDNDEGREANNSREAPATPSTLTPSKRNNADSNSNTPPGITFTRSAALGLPSPIVAGLFADRESDKSSRYTSKSNVIDAAVAAAAVDSSGDDSSRRGIKKTGRNNARDGEGSSATTAGAGGRKMVVRGTPPQPRKGSKLGVGGRSKTVPVGRFHSAAAAIGTRESPEGG